MSNLINDKFTKFNRDDYQRDNFDKFLKKVSFSYSIPSIHIAGTNGKGSVASFLSSIYIAQGYKVGLFTSPYLNCVNEMIKINNVMIDDETIEQYLKQYEDKFKKYNLSSFEIQTFIAFEYFKKEKVDLAVIECGMGGEEDATNIFTPILSIITSVSLEHTETLGTTISEIAYNKAGIIKEHVPVLVGKLSEEALIVVNDVSRDNHSPFYEVDNYHYEKLIDDIGYSFSYSNLSDLYINFPCLYEINNACLAIEATKILNEQFKVDEDKLRSGLKNNFWPGRMEKVNSSPSVYLDGAHNPEGIQKLVESIEKVSNSKPIHVIFACFKDKNIENMLNNLNLISSDISLTTFPHQRARVEQDYFLYLDDYHFEQDYINLIKNKIENYKDDLILITGSLAFVGLVRQLFKEG